MDITAASPDKIEIERQATAMLMTETPIQIPFYTANTGGEIGSDIYIEFYSSWMDERHDPAESPSRYIYSPPYNTRG